MRHGLYVYEPQTATLYDPASFADRERWLFAEQEHNSKSALAAKRRPWNAKGGQAFVDEVIREAIAPAIDELVLLDKMRLEYSFPINDAVEGRLAFSGSPAAGRQFTVEARVGVFHRHLEEVWLSLWPTGDSFTLIRLLSSWLLNADDVDDGSLAEMRAIIQDGMNWARATNSLDLIIAELPRRQSSWRKGKLEPVALAIAGRMQEASTAIEILARATWSGDPFPHSQKAQTEVFIQRFNELYDSSYRDWATLIITELAGVGMPLTRLSDARGASLTNYGDVVTVLTKWMATCNYLPLKRDLVSMLGQAWAKPDAAVPLAEEFSRRGRDEIRESTILVALGESFCRTADESVLSYATEIVNDLTYGNFRGPFVRVLGKMRGMKDHVSPILLALLGDVEFLKHSALVILALDAVEDLNMTEALPVIEHLVDSPDQVMRGRARSVRSRLRWLVDKQRASN
jgi:hypothetical protein